MISCHAAALFPTSPFRTWRQPELLIPRNLEQILQSMYVESELLIPDKKVENIVLMLMMGNQFLLFTLSKYALFACSIIYSFTLIEKQIEQMILCRTTTGDYSFPRFLATVLVLNPLLRERPHVPHVDLLI